MRYPLVKACLWLIGVFNRTKDRDLADILHEAAGRYQTRPQEGWVAPPDWACWDRVAPPDWACWDRDLEAGRRRTDPVWGWRDAT